MNTTELIEIAKECGNLYMDADDGDILQFAQRIEQPHLQRIAELEQLVLKNTSLIERLMSDCRVYREGIERLELDGKEKATQVEQLREALHRCKGFVEAYGEPESKSLVRKALEQTK